MRAVYGEEVSGLRIGAILGEFLRKHIKATVRRFTYLYLMRDFNVASLNLIIGSTLMLFGLLFGGAQWIESIVTGVAAPTGTVMLSVLPIIAGLQMLLFFLSYDIGAEPKKPVQRQAVLASLDPVHERTPEQMPKDASDISPASAAKDG